MRAKFLTIVVVAALLSGAYYAWSTQPTLRDWVLATVVPASATPAQPAADPEPARVVVAPVTQADVPITISGIGTVMAYNTVDAKSQVDGIIQTLSFEEGDDVKAGDALAKIDPAPYEARVQQWQAAKQRATAHLENAKSNLWRDQQLMAKDFATQKQTDAEVALVGQYTADLAEAEAQIKFAQSQLDNTVIRSPINGRTGIRNVDAGNFLRAADNTRIVTVVQTQPISVIITVPAKALAQAGISSGLSDLPATAYAQDGVALLGRGKIKTIDNTVDPATGTIKLKGNFANNNSKLWPGDFVDCKIVVESRHDGLTIPTLAIQHGPKGDFVWVVRPDSSVEPRGIKIRQITGDTALIEWGLEADEKVVTEGQFYLRQGVRVSVVPELVADKPEMPNTE